MYKMLSTSCSQGWLACLDPTEAQWGSSLSLRMLDGTPVIIITQVNRVPQQASHTTLQDDTMILKGEAHLNRQAFIYLDKPSSLCLSYWLPLFIQGGWDSMGFISTIQLKAAEESSKLTKNHPPRQMIHPLPVLSCKKADWKTRPWKQQTKLCVLVNGL